MQPVASLPAELPAPAATPAEAVTPAVRRVVLVGYDDVELLDLACPADTFDAANRLGAQPPYRVELATLDGRNARTTSGFTLVPARALRDVTGPIDTLLVAGALQDAVAARDPILLGEVRRLAGEARRLASVCTGASVLAAAGLIDGRRVTTHWAMADQLARAYPAVTVDSSALVVRDGHVTTSGGVTSALDLSLAFVEEDHGSELARRVARLLVTYLQRPANQAQVSAFVPLAPPRHRLMRLVAAHVESHLSDDLSAPALSSAAGVSPRHLSRLMREELGTTPANYVREARIQAAAQLLTTTELPVHDVARECGLGSAETLRRAFAQRFHIAPSAYRRLHGGSALVG